MVLFTDHLVAAVIQIVVLLAVPFLWWLITARRERNFFSWLGWVAPRIDKPRSTVLVGVAALAFSLLVGAVFIAEVESVAPSPLAGLGFSGLGAAVVFSVAQTAFAEESLFRGFLLKRIAARCGFAAGNTVQAVLFGLAHMLPLVMLGMAWWLAAATAVYSGLLGAIMGWMNERRAAGSLVPGFILHAVGNLISGGMTLFLLG